MGQCVGGSRFHDADGGGCSSFFRNFQPERRTDGLNRKWSVSRAMYPADRYPAYCNGWLYVLTPALARNIAAAAATTPFHFVDDIFVTGLARERVAGSRVEYLTGRGRGGRLWRWLWTEVLSHCPLFGLLYHHLLQEVADVVENRPARIFYCIAMEYFLGQYVCGDHYS